MLRAPEGTTTRPTSDRVREAMFNALWSLDAVEGATVADLYAGSGALGIEALSRGAGAATFVESSRGRAVGHRGEPAQHRAGRPGHRGARRRDRAPGRDHGPVRPGPGRPALRLRRLARPGGGGAGPAHPGGPAGRRIGPGAGPRRAARPSSGRSGTAVRWWCSPVDSRTLRSSGGNPRSCARWHEPGDVGPVPGLVRPDPQRPPRDHRGRVHALRRGHRRRHAQPAEGRADVRPRGAQGDPRGVGRAPRQRRITQFSTPGRRPGQGGRRRLHHQGPARRVRLRVARCTRPR